MNRKFVWEAIVLGAFLCTGLVVLGLSLSRSIIRIKSLDRTVVVKGLSEREVTANVAIWPIKFTEANNDLNNLVSLMQQKNDIIVEFLKKHGFAENEISISAPSILDRQAQEYGDYNKVRFRYSGKSTITVYSENVDSVRKTMRKLVELGKKGIAIGGQDYQNKDCELNNLTICFFPSAIFARVSSLHLINLINSRP